MYIRRNVFTKTEEQKTTAPFDIDPDVGATTDDDTATTPPITKDTDGEYKGKTSPRVIQRLVDEVEALRNG